MGDSPNPPQLDSTETAFVTAGETQVTNDWDVYSPSAIYQGGQLALYYGGWGLEQLNAFDMGVFPHDVVYRMTCSGVTSCSGEQNVMDAADWGWIDVQGNTISELNDPSIIQMPDGYYIMYMTALDLPWIPNGPIVGVAASNNHVEFSTSWDGLTWSQPSRLLPHQWLPSATIVSSGDVYVYTTSNINGVNYLTDMGPSGVVRESQTPITTTDAGGNPRTYLNLHVQWVPSINAFQMVAETFEGNDDYLYSYDGVNFTEQFASIVQSNQGHPSAMPQNFCTLFYGNGGNVFVDDWCSSFF